MKYILGFPGSSAGKESTYNAGFNPWVGKTPWRRVTATHSRILAWTIQSTIQYELHNPRGHKKSDTTEELSLSL